MNASNSTPISAIKLAVVASIIAPAVSAMAVPVVFAGTDASNGFVNSEAAYTDWSAAVGSHTLDNLDGLVGAGGFGGSFTSDLGNTFTIADDDFISINNFGVPVMDGTNLRMTGIGAEMSFVWDMATGVDAFGFFSRDNDGGVVTITFDDGTFSEYSLTAAPNGNDNLFWGITGLGANVMSVAISSTDMDAGSNNSFWDRFVYRPAAVAMPEPGQLSLLGLGGLLMLASRRLAGRR